MQHHQKNNTKMIYYDDVAKQNISKHNPNQPQIRDRLYRTLINGGSGSGKTNALLNLIKNEDDDNYSVIDKAFLYIKDRNEKKCQYLISNCKSK